MAISISLTTFVDFCVRTTPSSRVSVVRDAIEAYDEYQRVRDPYKDLRDAIVQMHKSGKGAQALQACAAKAWNTMADHYTECIAGYEKFMGRRKFIWQGTPRAVPWPSGDLRVTVNPELGVAINGVPHVLKLYFKAEPLSKVRANTILFLLQRAYPTRTVGVVDIRRGRLITTATGLPNVEMHVHGEAAAFVTIWTQLGGGAAA